VSDVHVERADGVVTLTLNRPNRRNAITTSMVEEVIQALEDVARTHDDRALVMPEPGR
jgi:2-(1,2-epoxy-1,2-dihydrophenyl)acetyl-CoA isomerase